MLTPDHWPYEEFQIGFQFFGRFRKAANGFVMSVCLSLCPSVRLSVCPSGRMEQLGSHRTDFHEIWNLKISRKSAHTVQVSLQSDKNKGYFTGRIKYTLIISRSIIHKIRNVSANSCRENQNFLCSLFFNRVVFYIMWKNIVQPDRL